MILLCRQERRRTDGNIWRLFGSLLTFVYHCIGRIVIFDYLPLLTRPEHTGWIDS